MKVYIPFNMIVDTDFGIIRLIEQIQNISEYPTNKLKSFLLKRRQENPITEYSVLREFDVSPYSYGKIMDKYYEKILPLSSLTDMIAFVLTTYKLGVTNEISITIGCETQSEIDFLSSLMSSLDYSIHTELNNNLKLNAYDYIFVKYLNYKYVDYLLDELKISGKRIYVADYNFNTIYDEESHTYIIDPELHIRLESEGNVLCTVSLYNKKKK